MDWQEDAIKKVEFVSALLWKRRKLSKLVSVWIIHLILISACKMSAYFEKCWQQAEHPLRAVKSFSMCKYFMGIGTIFVRVCVWEWERLSAWVRVVYEAFVKACSVSVRVCGFMQECVRICVRVCVFPPVPEGGCWITGPFWQAGTLRAVSPLARPGMSSEKKRGRGSDRERERGKKGASERERDRGLGGLHVFRLIGGQRSASPPARTDSWNLWAVSTALPLKDFLSDHVYKRGRGSQ